MKRSKGFTLIELLAVIVILAIIALIAIPQVMKILNKARESAAKDSAYGVTKAAENYAANFMLQNNGEFPSEDLVFECNGKECALQDTDKFNNYNLENLRALDFKGTIPTSGKITVSGNGKTISATDLKINDISCNYDGEVSCGDEELKKGYTIVESTGDETYLAIVYLNPTNLSKKCEANDSVSTTGTKEGCMKWYAYAETDTTYDLILDHNTTAKVNSYSAAQTQITTDTANWDNILNARNIKADEVATITGHPTFKQATATTSNWFYLDSNSQTKTATSQGASNYAWAYDYTYKCTSYGCNTPDSSTYGYWTQDMVSGSSSNAWNVYSNGYLGSISISTSNFRGVRPVITISKS